MTGRRLSDVERIDRSILEDDLLKSVLQLARLERWLVWHIRRSDRAVTQGDPGLPDLLLCRPPRLIFAELKRETEDPRPEQAVWIDALRRSGGEVYVWRPSDWRTGRIEEALQ